MKSWDVKAIDVRPRLPAILSSTDEARAIVLHLGAGDSLQDHEVHERAWVVVIEARSRSRPPQGSASWAAWGCLWSSLPASATRSMRAQTPDSCSC